MINVGIITPGTGYVRVTAASGSLALHVDNKDLAVNTVYIQADAANDTVGTVEYCGDEFASVAKAPTTGELPMVKIETPSGVPNGVNLKQVRIKGGDSGDKFHVWATQN